MYEYEYQDNIYRTFSDATNMRDGMKSGATSPFNQSKHHYCAAQTKTKKSTLAALSSYQNTRPTRPQAHAVSQRQP